MSLGGQGSSSGGGGSPAELVSPRRPQQQQPTPHPPAHEAADLSGGGGGGGGTPPHHLRALAPGSAGSSPATARPRLTAAATASDHAAPLRRDLHAAPTPTGGSATARTLGGGGSGVLGPAALTPFRPIRPREGSVASVSDGLYSATPSTLSSAQPSFRRSAAALAGGASQTFYGSDYGGSFISMRSGEHGSGSTAGSLADSTGRGGVLASAAGAAAPSVPAARKPGLSARKVFQRNTIRARGDASGGGPSNSASLRSTDSQPHAEGAAPAAAMRSLVRDQYEALARNVRGLPPAGSAGGGGGGGAAELLQRVEQRRAQRERQFTLDPVHFEHTLRKNCPIHSRAARREREREAEARRLRALQQQRHDERVIANKGQEVVDTSLVRKSSAMLAGSLARARHGGQPSGAVLSRGGSFALRGGSGGGAHARELNDKSSSSLFASAVLPGSSVSSLPPRAGTTVNVTRSNNFVFEAEVEEPPAEGNAGGGGGSSEPWQASKAAGAPRYGLSTERKKRRVSLSQLESAVAVSGQRRGKELVVPLAQEDKRRVRTSSLISSSSSSSSSSSPAPGSPRRNGSPGKTGAEAAQRATTVVRRTAAGTRIHPGSGGGAKTGVGRSLLDAYSSDSDDERCYSFYTRARRDYTGRSGSVLSASSETAEGDGAAQRRGRDSSLDATSSAASGVTPSLERQRRRTLSYVSGGGGGGGGGASAAGKDSGDDDPEAEERCCPCCPCHRRENFRLLCQQSRVSYDKVRNARNDTSKGPAGEMDSVMGGSVLLEELETTTSPVRGSAAASPATTARPSRDSDSSSDDEAIMSVQSFRRDKVRKVISQQAK